MMRARMVVAVLAAAEVACGQGPDAPVARDAAERELAGDRDASGDLDSGPTASAEAPIAMRMALANGIEMHFRERAGPGPLVVLLHGFPDLADTWDDISAALNRAGYRTVAPYLRAYLPTEIPSEDSTLEVLGRDVSALIDALGAENAIVVGHDQGAAAAYAVANLAPERVRALVTVAVPHPLARAKHPDWRAASPHFAELALPDAAAAFRADDYAVMEERLRRWSPSWRFPAHEAARLRETFDRPGCLEAVLGFYRSLAAGVISPVLLQPATMPGLTFYGTEDGALLLAPFADQQAGFALPVRVVEVQAGHYLHREDAALFLEETLTFLASL